MLKILQPPGIVAVQLEIYHNGGKVCVTRDGEITGVVYTYPQWQVVVSGS